MKHLGLPITMMMLLAAVARPQSVPADYPEPEFYNEVTYLNKSVTPFTLQRLEKEYAKMNTKTKFGGYEMGYSLDGEKSTARLASGNGLTFVYVTSASGNRATAQADSVMQAHGMDASMMAGGMGYGQDPASKFSLYRAIAAKGQRKILTQNMKGSVFGAKDKSSEKIAFSVRAARDGYWVLELDKPLTPGEYAFTVMEYNAGSMDSSIPIFAFGID